IDRSTAVPGASPFSRLRENERGKVRRERFPQTLPCPVARVVTLARIKAKTSLGAQIVPLEPAAQARHVVRAEGSNRLLRIGLRPAEAAIVPALEQHHAIAPEAPAHHRLAKALWHRAQVLADDDAARTEALLRDRLQQRLEGIAHISALARRAPARNHEQSLE